VSKIVVAQNAPGDPVNQGLDVFALTWDYSSKTPNIKESRQAAGTWSSWSTLPNITSKFTTNGVSDIAVGLNQNNTMQVFETILQSGQSKYQVYTMQQQTPGGLWTTWYNLGAPSTTTNPLYLQVGFNQINGTLEIFASDGTSIFRMAQPSANVQDWGQVWYSEGSPAAGTTIASFCVGVNGDRGRLELFVITTEPKVYHDWQKDPAGDWSGWWELTGGA
jgi:hypothetical protein